MRGYFCALAFCVASAAISQPQIWPVERQDRWGTGQAILGPNPATFTTPWIYKRTTGGIVSHGPVFDENGIGYYGTWVSNLLVKMQAGTGITLGSFSALNFVQSSAALSPDSQSIYFHAPKNSSSDPPGRLFRINATTMDFDWVFQTNVDKINDYEGASPMVGPDGDVVFGNRNGTAWRIDDVSGAAVWTRPGLQEIRRTIAFSRDDSKVFVSNGTRVTALNYVDGTIAWTRDLGSMAAGPGVAPDGTVVCGSEAGTVFGLNPATGAVNWTRGLLGAVRAAPAFSSLGVAYTTDYGHRLTAIRTSDGFRFWSYTVNHEGTSSPTVGHDGRIYLMDRIGWLYCVAPDGSEVWRRATGGESRGPLTIGPDGTLYIGVNGPTMTFALVRQQETEFLFDRLTASIGDIIGGGVAQVHASDNAYATLRTTPFFTFSRTDPQIRGDFEMDCPQKKLLSYTLQLEASCQMGSTATQRIELFNFQSGQYELVDARPGSVSDAPITLAFSNNATRFVNAGSGLIKGRISWKLDNGPRVWTAQIDEIRLLHVVPDWNP